MPGSSLDDIVIRDVSSRVVTLERPRTLADVLLRLEADVGLDRIRKRDLLSSVRWVTRALQREPDKIEASLVALKRPLVGLRPASLKISPKTLANHRANFIAALRHVGAAGSGSRRGALAADWLELRNRLTDLALRNGLSRLCRFCSSRGIRPEDVNDSTIEDFVRTLDLETYILRPEKTRTSTCRLWNRAVESVPGWPSRKLAVNDGRPPRQTLRLEEMSPELRHEINEHLAWLKGADLFAEHRPPRALKPRTVALRRHHLQLAVTALVLLGRPAQEIRSIAVLVEPNTVKEILSFFHRRANAEITVTMKQIAKALISVARHWLRLDPAAVERLKELTKIVRRERIGLTDKNQALLDTLSDKAIRARLLTLPYVLQDLAKRGRPSPSRAPVTAQVGLAVELLLKAPMRIGNLIGLRLDEHIRRRNGAVHIVVPGETVKNGERLVFRLGRSTSEMFETYVDVWRPKLDGAETPYLFATKNGRKFARTLAEQIAEAIRKHVGVEMTPHQFRHFSADLTLEARPGAYQLVSTMLGHRSRQTAITFYVANDVRRANEQYDEIVEQQRAAAMSAYRRKPRR